MGVPVFLSHPKPCNDRQRGFVAGVNAYFASRGIDAKTLGVSEYDGSAPLAGVRRLMLESNGVLVLALRRYEIRDGCSHHMADDGACDARPIANAWMTSPWCHIEAAMGFQLGLPTLILRERGVLADGVLERGVIGMYMPEFDLDSKSDYFATAEWTQLISQFEARVRGVRERKGVPALLGI